MDLSITTDYARDTGAAQPYLRQIADAGFSHVHWCHEWSSDLLYDEDDLRSIERWLRALDLKLLDLHASAGRDHRWCAQDPGVRRAGLLLVANRIDMTAQLGGRAIVLHLSDEPKEGPDEGSPWWDRVRAGLDELTSLAASRGVIVAMENGSLDDRETARFERYFSLYPADRLGFCYDSGHGNLRPGGLAKLERFKDRLVALHLHDNDGTGDHHNLPFSGTIDWPALVSIIARSSYRGPLSFEVSMRRAGISDEAKFLARAHEVAARVGGLLEECQQNGG